MDQLHAMKPGESNVLVGMRLYLHTLLRLGLTCLDLLLNLFGYIRAYPVNSGSATFTGSHVHYIDYDRKKLSKFMESDRFASEMIKGFGQVSSKMVSKVMMIFCN